MAKRSDETHIRKITKVGGHSLSVTIPIDLARALKLRERQKVTVTQKGTKLHHCRLEAGLTVVARCARYTPYTTQAPLRGACALCKRCTSGST